MVDDIAVQEFVDAIKEPQLDTNNVYSATVSRIDKEGVVWVNIHGSDKETPTASASSEVERGDVVNVTWRNNKLYIGGNYSNPSAGVERVIRNERVANDAHEKATTAMESAETAREAAEQAVADAEVAASAAQSASQSAASAGQSASQAQAASQAAQAAALGSVTTDTIHYLATSQGSGVTRSTAGWTTAIQTIDSTNKYLWTYHTYTTVGGVSTDSDPVITGAYGEKGADGTSVTILGSYNTLADLQTAHPTGSLGDSYMVGTDLYVWNGSAWENVGQIQGDKGDKGDKGDTGDTGAKGDKGDNGVSPTVTTSKSGDVTTITIVDANGTHTATITDGEDGESPTVSKSGSIVTITDASGNVVTVSDGANGQSIKGDAGDDAYLHIAWANSADGTTDFSTTVATGKLYMGTYTDHTATDSISPSAYKWVKVKGEQGVQGTDGDDGVSVTAVQPQYYLSTSSSQAQGGSWSLSLTYVVGKFIWTRDYITYSDNTSGTSEEIYNEALTKACLDAANALGLIEEQQEYFWHDSLGAHVLSSTDTTGTRYRTDIKGAGFEIYEIPADDTEKSVAKFGASTRIGAEDSARLELGGTSVRAYSPEGVEYFTVNAEGGSISTTTYENILDSTTASPITISLNDYPSYVNLANGTRFYIYVEGALGGKGYAQPLAPTKGTSSNISTTKVRIVYTSSSNSVTITQLGSDVYSIRAKLGTTTTASAPLYRFGNDVAESGGAYSFLLGQGTTSTAPYQLVAGKYNSPYSTALLIIGNGTSDNARSNALTVDWNGNVDIASGAKYKINGTNLSASDVGALPISGGTLTGNLTIGSHDSPVGTVQTESWTDLSLANTTSFTTIETQYMDITAGAWIITQAVNFESAASGKRCGSRLYDQTHDTAYNGSASSVHTSGTGSVRTTGTLLVKVTETTRFRVQAFQTSVSSTNVNVYIRAMRIA